MSRIELLISLIHELILAFKSENPKSSECWENGFDNNI